MVKTSTRFGMIYFYNFKNEDMVWGLLILGKEVEIINTDISIESKEDKDVSFLREKLVDNRIDIAVSYNFSPALSDACMGLGIAYICWIYDSPIQMLYERQISNNCNYIFSFDKDQVRKFKKVSNSNIVYLPLGSNITRNNAVEITKADIERYSCDVSFIGSLYSDEEYKSVLDIVSEKTQIELRRIYEESYGKWDGIDRLYGRLSKEAQDEIYHILGNETNMDLDTLYTTVIIVRALACRERIEMLMRLSRFNVSFHTQNNNFVIPGVEVKPPVNYLEDLPNAYRLSKINMNLTMRGITSGVPLRVFDIMGVGGFMLTNFQPEIDELFSIGKDIEVYQNFDELEEKVEYYLRNDDIRQKIAKAGAKTISEQYSVERQMGRMLDAICK